MGEEKKNPRADDFRNPAPYHNDFRNPASFSGRPGQFQSLGPDRNHHFPGSDCRYDREFDIPYRQPFDRMDDRSYYGRDSIDRMYDRPYRESSNRPSSHYGRSESLPQDYPKPLASIDADDFRAPFLEGRRDYEMIPSKRSLQQNPVVNKVKIHQL